MESTSFPITSLGGDQTGALISISNGLFSKAGTGSHSVFIPLRRVTRTQQRAPSRGTMRLVLGGGVGSVEGSLETASGRCPSGGALRTQVSEEDTSRTTQQQVTGHWGQTRMGLGVGVDGKAPDRRGNHPGGFLLTLGEARFPLAPAPPGPQASRAPTGSDRESRQHPREREPPATPHNPPIPPPGLTQAAEGPPR